jgi:hypothetical protein
VPAEPAQPLRRTAPGGRSGRRPAERIDRPADVPPGWLQHGGTRRAGARRANSFRRYRASSISPVPPRRNPARLWTAAGVTFALAVAAMIAWSRGWAFPTGCRSTAHVRHGPPRSGAFVPPARQDRRTLPNGTAYFGASGTVTNVGKDLREVPADPDRAARCAKPHRLHLGRRPAATSCARAKA